MKTLHILNGDASLHLWQKAGFKDDYLVWREFLSDGPVSQSIGEESFWKERENFLKIEYQVPPKDHQKKSRSEFQKLEKVEEYDEICLWFEYDLFCQVNLIAAITLIEEHHQYKGKLTLVCVGEEEGYQKKVGLGELPPKIYPQLFDQRITLSKEQIDYAIQLWKVYQQNNRESLKDFLDHHPSPLPYCQEAMTAHLKRFPINGEKLNEIQKKILEVIKENAPIPKNKVIREMLLWQDWYGFGDLQYFHYLDELSDYYVEKDGVLEL